MTDLFLSILNRSITASWLILAVLLIRFLLKKAPKSFNGLLWLLVGVRLMVPITFESIFSLIPSANTIPDDVITSSKPIIQSGIEIVDNTVNPILSNETIIIASQKMDFMEVLIFIAGIVWIIGVLSMLIYSVVSYIKLQRQVQASLHFKDNVYFCDDISTAFILGVIHPKIYIPSMIQMEYLNAIVAHENAHLKRKDHIWKIVGYIVLSIHWFNPVVWIAYIMFGRDIELACDELVTLKMEEESKKEYCKALVSFNIQNRLLLVCPLAFGEIGVKERIKQLINYKKPTFWIIVVACVLCVVTVVGFMSNPYGVKITEIERLRGDYSTLLDDVNDIEIANEYSSYSIFFESEKESIVELLKEVKLSSKTISYSESGREQSYSIKLNDQKVIYFNEDYSLLWVDDGVFASDSYKVKNKNVVSKIFEPLTNEKNTVANKTQNYIDCIVGDVDESGNVTVSSSYFPYKDYVMNLADHKEDLDKFAFGQKIRVFYEGTLDSTNPAKIDNVTEIYFLYLTTIESNLEDLKENVDEGIRFALKTHIENIEMSIYNNNNRDEYYYNKFQKVYIYYDKEESDKLVKERGYDDSYFAIFEKYYGGNVLEPTKEEGYGYTFYTYEVVNGEIELNRLGSSVNEY